MPNIDHEGGIGSRVKAARQRLGWSREALAFHAGISWSAISQLEAGRRRNLRPSTLAALAGALGVSVDYLVCGRALSAPMLEHGVVLHESDDAFAEAAGHFLTEGADRSEAALAVTTAAHCDLLRERLGPAAARVEFADQAAWCDTPGGAVMRLRSFIDAHSEAGKSWVRIVVEPPPVGRTAPDGPLWARYEALLNIVFHATPLTALCAYDAAALDSDVLEQVLTAHPYTLDGTGELVSNDAYQDPVQSVLASTPNGEAIPPTGVNR
jgi:transcriptional regulator with XRE-family HTH domain